MADLMIFPKTIQEFIKDYSFKDEQEIYTNGAMLIPVFRMEQAHIYYGEKIREKAIDDFYDKVLNFEDYIEPVSIIDATQLYSGRDITKMIQKIVEEMRGN